MNLTNQNDNPMPIVNRLVAAFSYRESNVDLPTGAETNVINACQTNTNPPSFMTSCSTLVFFISHPM